MNRDLSDTISFIKKYLLKKYDWFEIDINESFLGCKFHYDKYYIFFVSMYEDEITFTCRLDFTKIDVNRISIENANDSKIKKLIDISIFNAMFKNDSLPVKKKLLTKSIVNYNYIKSSKNDTSENTNDSISHVNDVNKLQNEENIEKKELPLKYLTLPLENVKMSKRLRNGLINNGKKTLSDFTNLSIDQLKEIRNLGEKSVKEAEKLLNDLKYSPEKFIIFEAPTLKENFEVKISDDLIERLYSKIPIEKCDFSVRLINCLKNNNIITLADFIRCSKEKLEEIDNLGRKSFKEAMEYKRKIYNENQFGEDNSDFIIRVLNVLSVDNDISVIMLKNYLSNNTQYPVENLVNDINNLRNKGMIEFTMNGLRFKRKKLREVLEELSESTRMLIVERLNGKTLQEMGESRGITRERVRQKFAKEFNKLPPVDEDKYKALFEEYSFSEEDFIKLFNVEKNIYNYLKEKYKSGELDLDQALEDKRFNEKQKEIIRGLRKITKLFGETVVINRQNIVTLLAKQYAKKGISIADFVNIYNNFVKENISYNLPQSDHGSMEGILYRSGIALFCLGNRFRYYDFDSISQQDFDSLKEIFFSLDTGYYSTLVIYKSNKDLMNSIDIRDEYELHNLCKSLFNNRKGIVFYRMPNFSINGTSKNEFTEEKIKELAPISIVDFVEIIESEYGHKSSTFYTYVVTAFQKFIDNGVLKSNIATLPDFELEKIKHLLFKTIYNIDELKKLLESNGYENTNEIITSTNMYKMGYRIRSSYICRKDIGSIEEYLRNMATENDFIANDNFLKNSTYSTMIKKVERSLDIFLISNEEYITIKKLNSLGITKKDIFNFCEEVKDKFKDVDYFTLSNVRDLLDIDKLDDFGFDDIFLENIIGNIENIFYTKFSNNKIFSFVNKSFNSTEFLLDVIGSRISMFIDELQNELKVKYGIEVRQEKIKNAIIDTDMYYSDELNKIYQNKEYYYEEVFSYE